MPTGLIDTLAEQDASKSAQEGFAIAPGIVTENIDIMTECRVKVRIPAMPGFEPWARVSSVGGGSGRGFAWMPQVDDEVLLAFAQNDPANCYVLGGLWSTTSRPPMDIPTDSLNKRVIKTGISDAPGHTVEFDDLLQSVTITTSTKQKIEMAPAKLEISGAFGALSISMDTESLSVSITAAVKLELKATDISIQGTSVEIKGGTVSIQSAGPCSVTGLPIQLN
jgi:phage baseplate assembly protein gpV